MKKSKKSVLLCLLMVCVLLTGCGSVYESSQSGYTKVNSISGAVFDMPEQFLSQSMMISTISVLKTLFRIHQMFFINMVERVFKIAVGKIICHTKVHIQIIATVFWTCARNIALKITDKLKHFDHQTNNVL